MKYLFVLFLSFTTLQAQSMAEKYFVFFKDKGEAGIFLKKGTVEYQSVLTELAPAAIERRRTAMGEDNMIQFEDIPLNEIYIQQLNSIGFRVHHKLNWFNAVSGYIASEQKTQIEQLSFVERIEKVKSFKSVGTVFTDKESNSKDGSLFKPQTNYGETFVQLQMNEIPAVHLRGITGQGIMLGLLDSGFDWQTHDALKTRNVVSEYDFVFNDNITANQTGDSPSQHNHGTYVFSIAGGYRDSILIGAAYNASFLLAKTEDIRSEKNIEEDNYAAALQWMENRGVRITSSSLGYNEFDAGENSYTYAQMDGKTTIVTRAAELAYSRGVLTISAAGNEGAGAWKYIIAPSDGINTLAIAAVTSTDTVASFSGTGPTPDGRIKPDLAAMGVNTFGARASTTSQYLSNSGTSAATPIAAGAAALVWSAFPHLTNTQVKSLLIRTAGSFSRPNYYRGYGLINVREALEIPAIKNTPNGIVAEKIFFDTVHTTYNVYIFISKNNTEFDSVLMNFDGNYKYQAALTAVGITDPLYFYIKYESSAGILTRLPTGGTWYAPNPSLSDVYFEEESILNDFSLEQNYPNPFNGFTTFRFYTHQPKVGEVAIFDMLGQKIRTLYTGTFSAGYNTFYWNGLNDKNSVSASGAYIYSVHSGDKIVSQKMLYIK